MYLSSARTVPAKPAVGQATPDQATPDSQTSATSGTPGSAGALAGVPGNVVALGAVSLVTDISSEMVTAVLPVYLVFGLGLSPLGLGFVDGLYGGVTTLVRLAGGQVADRTQSRKAVAAAGYGISALAKVGLLAAGASVGWIAFVIGFDRTGKGLRTAPRDALISLSSRPETVGRSFGVHRAMDTAGAVAGPLLAFLILRGVPRGYDAIFVVSFCVALAGLVVLALFVRDHREPSADREAVSLRSALGLLGEPAYRRACLLAPMLALVTVSDAFVFLVLQRRLDVAVGYFPLFPLGSSLVYLVLAVPLGRLADRVGRWRVFVAGNVAIALAYALLVSSLGGLGLLVATLVLHGAFYAATDGVLMAAVSTGLPTALRTSGIALIQTGTAAAGLGSSLVFGACWTVWGPATAMRVFLAALVVAIVVAVVLRPGTAGARAGATGPAGPGAGTAA